MTTFFVRLVPARVAFFGLLLLCVAALPARSRTADASPTDPFIVLMDPDNSLSFALLHGPQGAEQSIGHVSMAGWGPKWAWASLRSTEKPGVPFAVSAPFVVNKAAGESIAIELHVTPTGKRSIAFQYDLTAQKDVPITIVCATLGFAKSIGGQLVATSAGKEQTVPLPLTRGEITNVSHVVFKLANAGDIGVDVQPAGDIGIDGDARFILAADKFHAGHQTVTLTLTFPADVSLVTSSSDAKKFLKPLAGPDWFAFTPTDDLSPSAIGMESWLEKPAGKRGGVRMAGDHFQLEDGTPIKFWGTNLAYGSSCAPEKKVADFTAARFARFGINAVRLHKFTYAINENGIGDRNDSTQFDPKGLDRLDYFSSQLKNDGVYFGWSHTYGLHVRPGDRAKLLAYDEIAKAFPGGNTYAFINFAPDVQDLMIESVVNLLKHKNPYTGLTYAQEPALCFIELQNEDDIFFYTSTDVFKKCPTYKKQFMQRFCVWLKTRYGSQDNLQKAWQGAIKPDETLAAGNIFPQLNPWFFSDDHLPKTTGGDHQRLLDSAAFLHDAQNQYYGRYVKAIRDAGYKGPINGSPWQAPSMLPHYYNLKSDYAAGYIDRHNYFGGQFADTMLAHPGSGYLSSGLQQVIDRPFGLSEWITVYPSLYSAEGPVLIATYCMGLQGWDASYEFQSSAIPHTYNKLAGTLPWGVWDADTPTQLGQFPLLARMIYRGDVKEAPILSIRRISDSELATGKFSFTDKVTQQGDIKSFSGSVPPAALAAGRAVVQFTDSPQPSTFIDMAQYQKGDTIVSATGQLKWNVAQRYVTIDTDGTKGLVGFAPGEAITLGNVHIVSKSPYASILLTAADPKTTLATCKTALLSALARSCNTGFTVFGPEQKVSTNGTPPILLEPVKATISIAGRRVKSVNVLDADGRRTGATILVHEGTLTIDTARDKSIYYELVYE
jgi:hypothetical protein